MRNDPRRDDVTAAFAQKKRLSNHELADILGMEGEACDRFKNCEKWAYTNADLGIYKCGVGQWAMLPKRKKTTKIGRQPGAPLIKNPCTHGIGGIHAVRV